MALSTQSLASGLALNNLTDSLQSQVMQTEGWAVQQQQQAFLARAGGCGQNPALANFLGRPLLPALLNLGNFAGEAPDPTPFNSWTSQAPSGGNYGGYGANPAHYQAALQFAPPQPMRGWGSPNQLPAARLLPLRSNYGNTPEYEPAPGFQPDLRERGAALDPKYADLQRFARDHNSEDGSPITPDSTMQQDVGHWNESKQATQELLRHTEMVCEDPTQTTDEQRAVLSRIDQQVNRQQFGNPDESLMARRDAMQQAIDKGQIPGDCPVAKAFAGFSQGLDTQMQTGADMYYKYGNQSGNANQLPPGTHVAGFAQPYLDNSPFNPNNAQ